MTSVIVCESYLVFMKKLFWSCAQWVCRDPRFPGSSSIWSSSLPVSFPGLVFSPPKIFCSAAKGPVPAWEILLVFFLPWGRSDVRHLFSRAKSAKEFSLARLICSVFGFSVSPELLGLAPLWARFEFPRTYNFFTLLHVFGSVIGYVN
jgi:hypothetical protein